MAIYDYRQMNRMRQDAMRRSQEMYQKSTSGMKEPSASTENKIPIPESVPANSPPNQKNSRSKNEINEFLNKFVGGKIDSDKLIIIALMVLLAKEGADMKLILALGYILL